MAPLAKSAELSSAALAPTSSAFPNTDSCESLFDQFAPIYIFCREHLFRDDTERVIHTLWNGSAPAPGGHVLEVGCGPGFYLRHLAQRFPALSFLGVDNSRRQLEFAREKARAHRLSNCEFVRGNVLDLAQLDATFTEIIASRLFTVLPDREQALSEMFRVLKTGGRCFLAEPRFAFSASLPLLFMRFFAHLSGRARICREPVRATALSGPQFQKLCQTQPWASVRMWRVGRYQYALCQKS